VFSSCCNHNYKDTITVQDTQNGLTYTYQIDDILDNNAKIDKLDYALNTLHEIQMKYYYNSRMSYNWTGSDEVMSTYKEIMALVDTAIEMIEKE
jgi:hypothetical protein